MLGAEVGSDALPRVTSPDSLEASPAIFPSPALDRLTRAHPATRPCSSCLPWRSSASSACAASASPRRCCAAAGGYLFWTLCEYWGHRTVFHFEPDHGLGKRLHWMIHGVHHDHPNDPRRLVLPPAFSIPLALLFLARLRRRARCSARVGVRRRLLPRLRHLRHAALPAPPHPSEGARSGAAARAAHAASLRGRRAWASA